MQILFLIYKKCISKLIRAQESNHQGRKCCAKKCNPLKYWQQQEELFARASNHGFPLTKHLSIPRLLVFLAIFKVKMREFRKVFWKNLITRRT